MRESAKVKIVDVVTAAGDGTPVTTRVFVLSPHFRTLLDEGDPWAGSDTPEPQK